MGFRINNNISALVAQGNLHKTQGNLSKSIERLSSGLRINRGADDAAGLTISEKLRWPNSWSESRYCQRSRWYFFNSDSRRGTQRRCVNS